MNIYIAAPNTPRSVFQYHSGRVELYMDDHLIKSGFYTDYRNRTGILKEWEMMLRNMYSKHIFYIHIIPQE